MKGWEGSDQKWWLSTPKSITYPKRRPFTLNFWTCLFMHFLMTRVAFTHYCHRIHNSARIWDGGGGGEGLELILAMPIFSLQLLPPLFQLWGIVIWMGALQFFLFVWQRRPNENILLMIMFRVADCHVNATALCVRVLLLPLYIHTYNLTHKVHQIVGLHIIR